LATNFNSRWRLARRSQRKSFRALRMEVLG